MERRPRDLRPDTRERWGAALVLSSHTSARYDWETVSEDPLTRVLSEIRGLGLLRNEKFG